MRSFLACFINEQIICYTVKLISVNRGRLSFAVSAVVIVVVVVVVVVVAVVVVINRELKGP